MEYKKIKRDKEVMIIQTNNMWRGIIISMVPGSKTKVLIKDIERGDGWCELMQKYKGVRKENGWELGKNNDYGVESIIHRKYLNEIV